MSRESTIRDLRTKARQLELEKRDIDKKVEAIYTTLRIFEQGDDTTTTTTAAATISTYAKDLTDGIYDVLISERPLHRSVILDRVQERGIHVGGQTPINTISSYLSTDERFRNVGKGLWTLSVEPQPEHVADEEHNNGHRQDNSPIYLER